MYTYMYLSLSIHIYIYIYITTYDMKDLWPEDANYDMICNILHDINIHNYNMLKEDAHERLGQTNVGARQRWS